MDALDIKRFWAKVDKKAPDKCWNWLGPAGCGKSKLYCKFWVKGKTTLAHRTSYEIANGDFDKFMHVLHHCDNPACVNPKHLFLGTNMDNIKDKVAKGRWRGGRPKFTPSECNRCKRMKQLCKGYCKSCYTTMRRHTLGRNIRGASPF